MKLHTAFSSVLKGLLVVSVVLFLSAAGFQDKFTSGWTLQILPNLNGTQISDVVFLDSLNGVFITNNSNVYDTSYIFKTTDGGNNWFQVYKNNKDFFKINFVNSQTGFVCGGYNSYNDNLLKTTNQGINWFSINSPSSLYFKDLSVLNEDTMWIVSDNGLEGGLFLTTNGGLNWTSLFYQFQQNPDKIYMVNKNLGFICRGSAPSGSYIGRTSNGGLNWSLQNSDTTFRCMKFIDSLTGWKSDVNMKKTTDGGLTWLSQYLPKVVGSIYDGTAMSKFSIINKDTVFGVGGLFQYPNNQYRCIIYKTTNGGLNWGYQIPDTSFNIIQLSQVFFTDKNNGWAFRFTTKCIHTLTGGSDTTYYTAINNNQNQIVSTDFVLEQNYPNPFNPLTNIEFKLSKSCNVKLNIYDVTGKKISTLVNEYKHSGNYSITFNAQNLPSGIYFYTLELSGNSSNKILTETKRMMLIK